MLAVLIWTKVDFDRSKAFFLGRRGPNSTTDRVSLLFWWFLSQIHPLARAEASQAVPRLGGQSGWADCPPNSRRGLLVPGTARTIFLKYTINIGTFSGTRTPFFDLGGQSVRTGLPAELKERAADPGNVPYNFFIIYNKYWSFSRHSYSVL